MFTRNQHRSPLKALRCRSAYDGARVVDHKFRRSSFRTCDNCIHFISKHPRPPRIRAASHDPSQSHDATCSFKVSREKSFSIPLTSPRAFPGPPAARQISIRASPYPGHSGILFNSPAQPSTVSPYARSHREPPGILLPSYAHLSTSLYVPGNYHERIQFVTATVPPTAQASM